VESSASTWLSLIRGIAFSESSVYPKKTAGFNINIDCPGMIDIKRFVFKMGYLPDDGIMKFLKA